MNNYLVISYLSDTEQIVFDTLLAESYDAAVSEVLRVRGEDVEAHEVYETAEFAKMAVEWAAATPEQTQESWNITIEAYGAGPRCA